MDLNSLIGAEFEIQDVRFAGMEECKPCYRMNSAIGPGAEAWLQGRVGLRARILTYLPKTLWFHRPGVRHCEATLRAGPILGGRFRWPGRHVERQLVRPAQLG